MEGGAASAAPVVRSTLKTLAMGGTSLWLLSSVSSSSHPVLCFVMGVLLMGVALSWMHFLSLECQQTAPVVSWLAQVPLLRASHIGVGLFAFFVVPLVLMRLGPAFVLKYWVLPFIVAHANGIMLSWDQVPRKEDSWSPWLWLWPLALPTREIYLWRHRDLLLVAALLTTASMVSLEMSTMLCVAPLLLMLPMLLIKHHQDEEKNAAAAAATTTPALITVRGLSIDAVRFAKHHPGGEDAIRAFGDGGGSDASGAFTSIHGARADAYLETLKKYVVVPPAAAAAPSTTTTTTTTIAAADMDFSSPFSKDLLQSISSALAGVSPYAPWQWWVRCALICSATLFFEWKWCTGAHTYAFVAVGVLHSMIGLCIQHDGSHGAVSRRPWINNVTAWGADWIGNSQWLWFQQHIMGHHPHTNLEHQDPDASSAEPLLFFIPNRVRPWFARHQWIYMWIVLPLYGPSVIYNIPQLVTMKHSNESSSSSWMLTHRPVAIAWRLFFFARIIVCPVVFGGASIIVAALGVPLITGAVLTTLFVVSHNFESSRRDATKDYYRLQVETSCSYGGWLASALTGGLNFQIEHHLVPRINSWHYPLISKAVRDACARHQVRYTYFPSFWQNLWSTIKYMRDAASPSSSSPTTATTTTTTTTTTSPLSIIMDGKRLDVTRFASRHPGGASILSLFGNRDALDQFTSIHSADAKRQLQVMLASAQPTQDVPPPDSSALAYRKLESQLRNEGYFTISWPMEVARAALLMSWYVAGAIFILRGWHWTGALLYGWGMQQSGWYSHDLLHHGVFTGNGRIWLGDLLGSFVGWLQGYDGEWWKDRHNMHHVVTNEAGADPDIDLAPLLTYMDSHARVALPGLRAWQHIYFVPLLSLLHVSWRFSSARFCVANQLWGRLLFLACNYVWMGWLFNGLWAPLAVLVILKGFLTAIFVFSTHYPEPRLPVGAHLMSLAQQTALTSRNITGGWLMDYMSGNISRQIEHHLFPTLPRYYLPAISGHVRRMFKECGLPYHESDIFECMKDNMLCLLHK